MSSTNRVLLLLQGYCFQAVAAIAMLTAARGVSGLYFLGNNIMYIIIRKAPIS